MLPARYQLLMTPVTSSVPTLTIPSVEKRSVARPCDGERAVVLRAGVQHQRQRDERADPSRRGDQMQNVSARVDNRFDDRRRRRRGRPTPRSRRSARPKSPTPS